MALTTEFIPLTVADLPGKAKELKASGARFVQLLAVRVTLGLDLTYSFMEDGKLVNYRVENVAFTDEVPSITGEYLNAFVFENEVHDLFGANITGIAIDFAGKFYKLTEETPMKFSGESKERLEKGAPAAQKEREARAAAAAKAAEEAKAKAEAEAKAKEEEEKKAKAGDKAEAAPAEEKKEAPASAPAEKKEEAPAPAEEKKEAPAEEEKKPAPDADKAAEEAAKLEEKLKSMDPEKAAKVRAAMEAKAKKAAAAAKEAGDE